METPAGTLELRSAGALVPLQGRGQLPLPAAGPGRPPDHRYSRAQGGARQRRRSGVDGPRRGAPAARGRGRGGPARALSAASSKGCLPRATLETLSRKFKDRGIPWQFVDVIEVDPARRVKLRIEYERLAEMHPSDLAEILEDLAPAEREAVFTSLDEEVAAETLEEVEPKLQKALLEKLDEEKIADIVEEMDPGAAADLLAELPEEQSDAILEEMEPEERQEVEELLEFDENSAAGCMTTDFVSLGMEATVAQAVQALRSFDGDPESVTEIYLLDEKRVLRGRDSAGAAGDGAAGDAAVGADRAARALLPGRSAPERSGRDVRQVQPARAAGGGHAGPHGRRGAGRSRDQLPARKVIRVSARKAIRERSIPVTLPLKSSGPLRTRSRRLCWRPA